MKKLVYLFIALFMGAHSLYAQDCATGYCPSTITVHHKVGNLSAASPDIVYGVAKITATTPICIITQNLGASASPTGWGDNTSTTYGWKYLPGQAQGYLPAGGSWTSVVNTVANETWSSQTDPCTLTFGSVWHVPTSVEWGTISSDAQSLWGRSKLNLQSVTGYNYTTSASISNGTNGSSGGFWSQNYGSATAGTFFCCFVINTTSTLSYATYTSGYNMFAYIRCVKNASN